MKRAWVQIGIGFLPLLLGFCCSLFFFLPVPFFLTNLLILAFWAWLCFRFCDPAHHVLPQLLRVCLAGAAVLVPALWLELGVGRNLPELLIHATQFYFFSGIHLFGRLLTPFLRVITAWPYYIAAYLIMSILSLLAMILKRKVS